MADNRVCGLGTSGCLGITILFTALRSFMYTFPSFTIEFLYWKNRGIAGAPIWNYKPPFKVFSHNELISASALRINPFTFPREYSAELACSSSIYLDITCRLQSSTYQQNILLLLLFFHRSSISIIFRNK